MYILHVYRNVNWSLWGECEWDRIRTKDSLRELIRESIIVINFKNYVLSNLLFVIKTILSRVIIIIIIFLEEINDAARVYTCNTFNLLWVDLLRPRGNGTVFPKIQLWLGNARNGGEKGVYEIRLETEPIQRARDGAGKINDPVAFRHLVRV